MTTGYHSHLVGNRRCSPLGSSVRTSSSVLGQRLQAELVRSLQPRPFSHQVWQTKWRSTKKLGSFYHSIGHCSSQFTVYCSCHGLTRSQIPQHTSFHAQGHRITCSNCGEEHCCGTSIGLFQLLDWNAPSGTFGEIACVELLEEQLVGVNSVRSVPPGASGSHAIKRMHYRPELLTHSMWDGRYREPSWKEG